MDVRVRQTGVTSSLVSCPIKSGLIPVLSHRADQHKQLGANYLLKGACFGVRQEAPNVHFRVWMFPVELIKSILLNVVVYSVIMQPLWLFFTVIHKENTSEGWHIPLQFQVTIQPPVCDNRHLHTSFEWKSLILLFLMCSLLKQNLAVLADGGEVSVSDSGHVPRSDASRQARNTAAVGLSKPFSDGKHSRYSTESDWRGGILLHRASYQHPNSTRATKAVVWMGLSWASTLGQIWQG